MIYPERRANVPGGGDGGWGATGNRKGDPFQHQMDTETERGGWIGEICALGEFRICSKDNQAQSYVLRSCQTGKLQSATCKPALALCVPHRLYQKAGSGEEQLMEK